MWTRLLVLGVIAGMAYALFALLAGPSTDVGGGEVVLQPAHDTAPRMQLAPVDGITPVAIQPELPGSVLVLVQDEHSAGIEGASVSGAPFADSGVTDEDGAVALDLASPMSVAPHLLVDARGWQREMVLLAQPIPERIVVTLEPGGALSGRVVWAGSDESAGAGLEVVAWPVGELPSERALLGLDPLLPPAVIGVTDQEARFTLNGIGSRRAHTIAVRSPGLATTSFANQWRPDAEGACRVEVAQVYGLAVSLEDAEGGALRTTPTAFGPQGIGFGVDGPGAPEVFVPEQAELLLAGLDIDLAGFEGRDDLLVLATASQGLGTVATCTLTADVPGYVYSSTTFPLPRLTGRVDRHVLGLQQEEGAFADLDLRFLGSEWVQAVPGRVHPFGSLILENDRGAHVAIGLTEFTGAPVRLLGVPEGRYRVRLDLRNGLVSRAAREQGHGEVEVIGATRLTFDLSGLGTATCVVEDPAGERYDGYAVIQAVRVDGQTAKSRPIHFYGSPYVVEGLPAGKYEFALLSPPSTDAITHIGADDHAVRVTAGLDTAVVLAR